MKKFALLLLLLACAGIGFWKFREYSAEHSASSATGATTPNGAQSPQGAPGSVQPTKGGPGGRGGDGAPVPVLVGEVTKSDLPLFLSGLGNVQGFNTVTIRSRVDGQLEKVSFSEGQEVKEGDVLAQIDPRPFQAALDQAKAPRNSRRSSPLRRSHSSPNSIVLSSRAVRSCSPDVPRGSLNSIRASCRIFCPRLPLFARATGRSRRCRLIFNVAEWKSPGPWSAR